MNDPPLGLRARDDRERILLATASVAAQADRRRSVTTQQIADAAGVTDAVVHDLVGDVETCILDACAWSANRAFAVALHAYDGPSTWPEKVRASILALTDLLAPAEDVVALHVLVLPRLGTIGMERMLAEREAFTAFLTAGVAEADACDESVPPASPDFVGGAVFQVLALMASEHRINQLPQMAPDLIRVVLTPFCAREVVEALV